MFQNLSDNLSKIFDKIVNRGVITDSQLDETMREIRVALLEADVNLNVAKNFIENVKSKAKGSEIAKSISPGQMIIKIVNDEIINLLKSPDSDSELNLKTQAPANILLVGLQGSGKTTTAGKLAYKLKKEGKKVLLVSLDIYRPAAMQQLETIAQSSEINSLPIIDEPISNILKRAKSESLKGNYDVVLYDTAGRLHIDEELIEELKQIKSSLNPIETIFVADSLTGQDAVNIASSFKNSVDVSSVILTRIDGDGRGGAALSIRSVTGCPIKFVGVGEKIQDLEKFQPDRIASRILGMGDVVSLVEKAISEADQAEMEKTAKKLQKGKFDLEDYISQIKQIQKMGGISSIMSMLPGFGKIKSKVGINNMSDKPLARQIAIVNSMTKKERKNPDILNGSRKKRISDGAGVHISEVNKLLKQFSQILNIIKKTKNMDPKTLMRNAHSLFGK